MTALCVQVQVGLMQGIDINRVRSLAERVATDRSVVEEFVVFEGEDNGLYINFIFETMELKNLWHLLQTTLYKDERIGAELSRSSIVTCEGSDGWNDYLLLHHFDPSEKVDDLESAL